jgi:hypothetical protein
VPNNDFEAISKESEALAQKLSESKDPETRRQLLGQLKLVMNKLLGFLAFHVSAQMAQVRHIHLSHIEQIMNP